MRVLWLWFPLTLTPPPSPRLPTRRFDNTTRELSEAIADLQWMKPEVDEWSNLKKQLAGVREWAEAGTGMEKGKGGERSGEGGGRGRGLLPFTAWVALRSTPSYHPYTRSKGREERRGSHRGHPGSVDR